LAIIGFVLPTWLVLVILVRFHSSSSKGYMKINVQ
jgi:hypothetical protein